MMNVLRQFLLQNNMQRHVEFVGPVPNQEMWHHMRKADAVVLQEELAEHIHHGAVTIFGIGSNKSNAQVFNFIRVIFSATAISANPCFCEILRPRIVDFLLACLTPD